METAQTIQIGSKYNLNTREIILLSADVNYTKIYLSNGKEIMVATTLKRFEKQFLKCSEFFRTHKSYLININYVKKYGSKNNELFVEMKNDFRVEVSRRRKTEFWRTIQRQSYL